MKILFVCTGNSCRSPMAEGLMNKAAKDKNLDVICASAGLFPDSDRASKNAIKAMSDYGIDISSHIPSRITEQIINEADLILTMTNQHKAVIEQIPSAWGKTFTLSEYAGDEYGSVSDPYGGDETVYKACADKLKELIDKVCDKIESET